MKINTLFGLLNWIFTPVKLFQDDGSAAHGNNSTDRNNNGVADGIDRSNAIDRGDLGGDSLRDSNTAGDWGAVGDFFNELLGLEPKASKTTTQSFDGGSITYDDIGNATVSYDNGDTFTTDAAGGYGGYNSIDGSGYYSNADGSYTSYGDYNNDGLTDAVHTYDDGLGILGTEYSADLFMSNTAVNQLGATTTYNDGNLEYTSHSYYDDGDIVTVGVETLGISPSSWLDNAGLPDISVNGIDTGILGSIGFALGEKLGYDPKSGALAGLAIGSMVSLHMSLTSLPTAMAMVDYGSKYGLAGVQLAGYYSALQSWGNVLNTMEDMSIAFGYKGVPALNMAPVDMHGIDNRIYFQQLLQETMTYYKRASISNDIVAEVDMEYEWNAGGEFYNANAGSFGYQVSTISEPNRGILGINTKEDKLYDQIALANQYIKFI